MHGTPLTIIPGLNRMLLGFYETNTNGRRVIAHGGDTQYFHSDLQLYVDDGVGYFISVNSAGKEGAAGPLRGAFFRQFSDRYLPGPDFTGKVDEATAKEHAQAIAGTYLFARRAESSLLSILNLAQPIKVVVNEDGTISLPLLRGLNGEPDKWHETEPYVWTDAAGKERLAAEVVDGRVTRFSAGMLGPIIMLERAPAAKAGGWLMPAAVASLVALALTVIFWPVAALVRRHYRKPLPFTGREAKAYRWVRIGALASLVAMLAWGGIIAAMFERPRAAVVEDGPVARAPARARFDRHPGRVRARGLAPAWSSGAGSAAGPPRSGASCSSLRRPSCAWIAIAYHLVGIGTNY